MRRVTHFLQPQQRWRVIVSVLSSATAVSIPVSTVCQYDDAARETSAIGPVRGLTLTTYSKIGQRRKYLQRKSTVLSTQWAPYERIVSYRKFGRIQESRAGHLYRGRLQ